MQRAVFVSLGFAIPAALVGSVALAGPLNQPNNTPIPQGNSLQVNGFDALGDPVNAIQDAEITPPTFLPTCEVEFTVYLRNAGYQNSFGWYNANGVAPALEDLFQILDCNEPVGTNTIVDILGDPNYEGGEIGFFQAVGGCANVDNPASVIHVLYSETQWNPDSNLMNPFIHLLIYESVNTPRTYYFAWEDLLQGGDNDFEDLFTSVSGIQCNGGPPCQAIAVPGDLDADLVCGADDNCPNIANPDQADADNDLLGDACDMCPDDPDPQCVGGSSSSGSESGSGSDGGMSSSDTGMGTGDTLMTTDTATGGVDTATDGVDTATGGVDTAMDGVDTATDGSDTTTGGGTGGGESGSDGGWSAEDVDVGDEIGSEGLGGTEVGSEDGCNCSTHPTDPSHPSKSGALPSALLALGLLGLGLRRRRR